MNQRSEDHVPARRPHPITRRGFLGGVAATVGGVAVAGVAPSVWSPSAAAQTTDATPTLPPPGDGQISVGWQKPTNFDPLFTQNGFEEEVQRLIFTSLVKMSDTLEPVPDLAESIDVSPDAKTYTFHLKHLTFTDGQPLTANDVIFTINRAVDKRTGSVWRGRLLNIQGATEYGDQQADSISGLTAPDDYTVTMNFIDPDSSFLVTLGDFSGFGIMPEHILKDVPPDQLQKHPFTLNPNVSAGAFTFANFSADQFLELDRNDSYAGGPPPPLAKIFLKILTADTALAQLTQGDLDIFGPGSLPVAELDFVKGNADLTVVSVPSPSVTFIAVNCEQPYLQDKRIRQAIQYAIDRNGIVSSLLKGEATVVNSTIIGPDWMGTPDGLNEYAFDPDKAKQLLSDANWDSSKKLAMIFPPGDQQQDAYAAVIQQQLKDVGIDISLEENEEFGTRLVDSGDYDLALAGGGVFRADPNVSSKYFATNNFTPAGANYAHYSNPQLDDLFVQGRATPDQAQRKQIYTQAAAILNDELPWICLWSPNSIFVYNNRVVGFKPPAYADNKLWNAETWSVTS